jgi:hypothetical protein
MTDTINIPVKVLKDIREEIQKRDSQIKEQGLLLAEKNDTQRMFSEFQQGMTQIYSLFNDLKEKDTNIEALVQKERDLDFERLVREVVPMVLQQVPIPKDGVNGVAGKDGKNADEEAIIRFVLTKFPKVPTKEEILASIPKPQDGKDAVVDEDKIIEDLIDRLKKKKELDISHIRNSNQFTFGNKKYKFEELMHGGGSGSATSVITYSVDLSAQADGLNKVFTVPTNTDFILLSGTDAPFIYRPVVDYTGSGTTTLTIDALVNAPSSGSTLILTYKN